MKKHFLFTLSFLLLSFTAVWAQTFTAKASNNTKDILSFGGNENGSTISILQIIDYPVLLLADTSEKVLSFDFKIVPEETNSPKIIKTEGAKLSQETLGYLRDLAGENGKIIIEHVMTQKGSVTIETPYRLEFQFNQ